VESLAQRKRPHNQPSCLDAGARFPAKQIPSRSESQTTAIQRQGMPRQLRPLREAPNGGHTWWAHLEFTRINIELTILHKKFEDLREVGEWMSVHRNCQDWPRRSAHVAERPANTPSVAFGTHVYVCDVHGEHRLLPDGSPPGGVGPYRRPIEPKRPYPKEFKTTTKKK
jgi:hypothetical protein